jgi:O-succinylbenzoic acid--CoA ligase
MMIVRSLVAECELHISEPSLNPLTGFESLEKIDLIPIVPAQLPALLAHGNRSGRIGNIIIGGAPLSYDQEKAVAESGLNAYATYGMTETCSHVALRKIGKDSFYTALPGYSFSTDSRGCLVIKSNQMSFKTLVTNDCVEILSDTQFKWLGRADNVINTGGIKVFPEKIEAQLAPLIKNRAFYITGRPSDRWGTEIVLVIEGSGFDKDHFFKQASEILPSRLLPKAIVEKEEIPRTSSGKIKRL